MKKCYNCQEVKPYDEFHKNRSKSDGLATECKKCRQPADKPTEVQCVNCGVIVPVKSKVPKYCSSRCKSILFQKSSRRVKWEGKNLDRTMLYRAKSRSKKLGLPFNLELEDCQVPDRCPVLGVKFYRKRRKGYHPHSPSLDRIIPELGYTKGNVIVVSSKANLIKNDATLEEIELVYRFYKTILKEKVRRWCLAMKQKNKH